jgi:hypothetical protein
VDQNVIGITLEGDIREGSRHPLVERMVHEQIGQDGADDPTLRRAARPFLQCPIR